MDSAAYSAQMPSGAGLRTPSRTDQVKQFLSRKWVSTAVRVCIVLAIVGGIALAVFSSWHDVVGVFESLNPLAVLATLVLLCAAILTSVQVWHVVLHTMHDDLRYWTTAEIYLVGQLGKYIPGSVWALVLQTELAKRAGIPRARAFTALITSIGISAVAAFTLAPFALPWVHRPWMQIPFLLAPLSILFVAPPVLSRIMDIALRVLRRPQPRLQISYADVAKTMGWSYLTYAILGAGLWMLAHSVAAPGIAGLFKCFVGMAMAMTLGLIVFVAPSGLGVREAFIVAALTPAVSAGTALGIALALRLIFIAADVLTAALAAVRAHFRLRDPAPGTPSP